MCFFTYLYVYAPCACLVTWRSEQAIEFSGGGEKTACGSRSSPSSLSFYVSPRDGIHVFMLGDNHLYLLRHAADLILFIKKWVGGCGGQGLLYSKMGLTLLYTQRGS